MTSPQLTRDGWTLAYSLVSECRLKLFDCTACACSFNSLSYYWMHVNDALSTGMLIGGYVWGSLADAIGRKVTLVTAMLWNGIFGLASAFSPNFAIFLAFRLASGIG